MDRWTDRWIYDIYIFYGVGPLLPVTYISTFLLIFNVIKIGLKLTLYYQKNIEKKINRQSTH